MSGPVDHLSSLRCALVGALCVGTWREIEEDHEAVELAWREDLEPGSGKPKYVTKVLETLSDVEVLALAERCLKYFPDRTSSVQDAVWWIEANGQTEISEVTRMAIADALDGRRMHPREDPIRFLDKIGTFDSLALAYGSSSLSYRDDGHLYRQKHTVGSFFGLEDSVAQNWERYSHRELLGLFGFYDWPDRRVILLLERLVHPTVRQGEEQTQWVDLLNGAICHDGLRLTEGGRISGRPVYRVRKREPGNGGQPKNLIFGSSGPKPVLGFADAINNDVVILKNAEFCLIYDEPLTENGLLWSDLAVWWAMKQGQPDPSDPGLRRALGDRLQASLGSEAERRLFAAYFRMVIPLLGDRLPALIPQVYLHFDPRTLRELRERGEERHFLVQRMDFLLLLPHGARIVVEVDGVGHYAEKKGDTWEPSLTRYAEAAKAERELRLSGYEVYRFGTNELRDRRSAESSALHFFTRLFLRHRLPLTIECRGSVKARG